MTSHDAEDTWAIASKWPLADSDSQSWWRTIGPQLTVLAAGAGYSPERQLGLLRFVHRYIVTHLGPRSSQYWLSLLTSDGTPLEYSWKWNVGPDSRPEIRYCIEAIGELSRHASDPVNSKETDALLHELKPYLEGLDLTWYDHFAEAFKLRQADNSKIHGDGPQSSVFVAFEHSPHGIVTKPYFVPPTDGTGSGAEPTFATFIEAVRSIVPHNQALQEMIGFAEQKPTLKPDMLAIDCIEPKKARIKLYVGAGGGSCIKDMLSIMSLGGKVRIPAETAASLTRLVQQVLGLDQQQGVDEHLLVQTPFDAGLAHPFDLYANVVYYFDIAPKSDLPDVKLYIPLNRYGQSDGAVAAGLVAYLCSEGRGQYVDGFTEVLNQIGQNLEGSSHRVQTFLAVAIRKDGTLDLTSYLNPGIYHAELKAKSAQQS